MAGRTRPFSAYPNTGEAHRETAIHKITLSREPAPTKRRKSLKYRWLYEQRRPAGPPRPTTWVSRRAAAPDLPLSFVTYARLVLGTLCHTSHLVPVLVQLCCTPNIYSQDHLITGSREPAPTKQRRLRLRLVLAAHWPIGPCPHALRSPPPPPPPRLCEWALGS
jgi:hypothetical protein